MKIYNVIPITKGISREVLSYFGPDNVTLGSLVSVPLRKRQALALVIGAQDAERAKTEIRRSDFSLKKIGSVKTESFLSESFRKTVTEISDWYAAPLGQVLSVLLPKIVLEHISKIKITGHSKKAKKQEKMLIQADDDERFAHYRSLIREEFARRSSVFFCVSTLEDLRKTKELLTKGIEQYTLGLSSDMGKKEFRKSIKILEEEKHPLLIIATIPFLSICRKDAGTIIVERENSRSYKTLSRPFIDLKLVAEKYAEISGIRFIAGDIMLSTETIWRKEEDQFVELAPLKFRSLSPAEGVLVDMKTEKGKFESEFRVLSEELETLISETKENNGHLFIFSARKGLSPTTVCGDCGQVVICNQCAAPVVLYSGKGKGENFFQCNRCGERRGAAERCVNCGSWKLTTLGIGLELVESEIKKKFPKSAIFSIDKSKTTTAKKASDVVSGFRDSPGSILLGTEMALPYLGEELYACAVASIDSLLSVPDFRINERVLYILLKLRMLSQKKFMIQTRNAEAKIFEYVLKGNLIDFYREEIEDRRKFFYPPFSVFIKATLEGKRTPVEKEMAEAEEMFAEWEPNLFESLLPSPKGNFVKNMLIRFNPKKWPDEKLSSRLKTLPPYWSVKVDPESLL
jgi:primosomal protein N'